MRDLATKQKRSVFAGIAALLGLVSILLGALGIRELQIKRASGQIAVEMVEELSDEYAFGDVFTLPQCKFIFMQCIQNLTDNILKKIKEMQMKMR